MEVEEIKKQLEKNCIVKKTVKIFNKDEIHAIHLMLDNNKFSFVKASEYFHCRDERIKKIVNLLTELNPKTEQDYEKICQEING